MAEASVDIDSDMDIETDPKPSLTLYISGGGRQSKESIDAAVLVADRFDLPAPNVVDIAEHPSLAEQASVLVVPSLVLRRPRLPEQVVAGELPPTLELGARLGLALPSTGAATASVDPTSLADQSLAAKALIWDNPDGIVVVDAGGLIAFVNNAAEHLFDRSASALIGTPLVFQASDDGPAELDIVVGRAVRTAELRTAPIRWDGQPATMATLRDVSDRKQAQVELERTRSDLARSNQDLEQFAQVASHDLKSPLSTINGAAQSLIAMYGQDVGDTGAELLAMIVRSVQRMTGMLDSFLAAAVVGSDLTMSDVDTAALVAEVVAMVDDRLVEVGGVVEVDPLPAVRADAVHLAGVFQNLVTNAIKYRSPERPLRIEIRARTTRDGVTFTIADNGIGIAPADRDRVFTMLSRLESGMERADGHGIGLSICRRVIERHGGRIWVDGSAEGTTFHVSLPQSPPT